MSIHLKSGFLTITGVAALLSLCATAHAAIPATAFAERYTPVADVTAQLSQVVYYRQGIPGEAAPAANIYVDQEFHTALLPGGFTAFCVQPGAHGLSAVQNDAPAYQGKQQQPFLSLEAGETVFIKVGTADGNVSRIISREAAEQELAGLQRQAHLVSRASTVQSCGNGAGQ